MRFKKTMLAKSLSSAIGALAVAPLAFGQTEAGELGEDKVLEVINVVGSRAALERAMDMKRESDGIVDGISAEDIGKFPDTNLAESLQRITGVAISRANGEGSQVTVRGMGPDRNLVTLNGRTLARTTGSRSFDFGNIASEMVTGVAVYKTSDASVPTGGIGATIDMLTNRPLDNSGKASITAKGLYDDSSADPTVTPEVSGIYSGAFELDGGGEFGVSLALSYAKRDSGNRQSGVSSGWRSFSGEKDQDWSGDNAEWGAIADDPNSINHPCPDGDAATCDQIYSSPQAVFYKFEEQQRERFNGQLVLQWAPNDDMTATLDYNYYDNKIAVQSNDVSTWFNYNYQHAYFTEEQVATPIIYKDYGTPDLAMAAADFANKFSGDSVGFNFEWQVNDSLALDFDAFTSEAKRTPDSKYGSSNVLTAAAFIRESTIADFTGDLPALSILGSNPLSADDMLATGSVFTNSIDKSSVDAFKFDGVFEINDDQSVEFGVSYSETTNHSQSALVQRDSWGGVGTAADYDDDLFIEHGIYDRFDGTAGDFSEVQGNDAYSSEEITALGYYYSFGFSDLIDAIRSTAAGSEAGPGDCGDWYCPSTDFGSNTDQKTKESTTAAYAQYKFNGAVAGMDYNWMVGLRYETTDVDSTAFSPNYDAAAWVSDNETNLLRSDDNPFVALSQSGSYDYWLPNFNFNLNITEDLIGRFAYSETIGRPNYNDIKGGTVIGSQARLNGGSGSAGNPSLLPLESENFDLSFEYYYGEGSYASLGFFWKDLSNFIGSDIVDSDVFGLPNPQDGERYQAARAALGDTATSGDIRTWIFDNYGDTEYVDVATGTIYGDPATDNVMNFEVTVPSNSDQKDRINGMEFAVQHFFGDSGFGAQANYTYVNPSYEYNNFDLNPQSPITGTSDTANVVGFYEKYGFSARIAYNWRDQYLLATGDGTGANPQYVEEYYQLDFNLSYEFAQLEGLQIMVEGYNITDQSTRIHSRTEQMVLNLTEGGARWVFGARYAF